MTPPAARRLSQAGLETLARVHAVGSCVWIPGSHPTALLDDAWLTALHVSTVRNLVRDSYLVPTGDEADHVLSDDARSILNEHPELRGRATTFYEMQAELARQRIRVDKPDFARSSMSREVKPKATD